MNEEINEYLDEKRTLRVFNSQNIYNAQKCDAVS